jgi:hypothetical protein
MGGRLFPQRARRPFVPNKGDEARQLPRGCERIVWALSGPDGAPERCGILIYTCRAQYPGGSKRVHASITSPLTRPSPNGRRVGIRIVTFEACSGFTRVTARRIAQPPKATFVTRLQPSQLPSQAARQLPDQSITLRVESSSTDDSRLRGALPLGDIVFHRRGNISVTMRYRGHTNNWPKAACVDRPGLLDWFQEQGDPRTLRFAAPLQPPKHLSRGR